MELVEISRRQAEQRMNKEYHDGLNELFRAQKVLDYYIALGNGQAERMSRLSQASYENGEIGYVEYIQNQQTVLDVQLPVCRCRQRLQSGNHHVELHKRKQMKNVFI